MKKNAYTLIELIVVIGIVVVLVGAGMAVFYQSLQSGSRVDFELFMNTSSRVIESSMTDVISFARVVNVDGQGQDACLAAGDSGVSGDNLTIDVAGRLTQYSLSGDYITSDSAQISPSGIQVSVLSFNWVCLFGEREKVMVDFTAQAEKDGEAVAIEKAYSFEVFLKNSGYF